jgi:hypothetical protein
MASQYGQMKPSMGVSAADLDETPLAKAVAS